MGETVVSLIESKEEKFWSWFKKNEECLLNFDKDRDAVFSELHSQMKQVNQDLVFEFGPLVNGKREFVLSAGGIKSVFPVVEKLYSAAPQMDKWSVIKFRPRRNPCDLVYRGKKVEIDNVHYVLVKGPAPDKVGIMLFLKDFNENESDIWWEIGFLLLDETLGEYDVGTKLGTIIIDSPQSEYFVHARPLEKLASDFDRQFK
ncbi:MAG: hypothetical protein SCH66_03845 [Methanolobus sp.]|nr:hypothetical protein [Methanolobus sp.]